MSRPPREPGPAALPLLPLCQPAAMAHGVPPSTARPTFPPFSPPESDSPLLRLTRAPDLHGKHVGVIGMGKIGECVARIFRFGFGAHVLCARREGKVPKIPDGFREGVDIEYLPMEEMFEKVDVLSLHCPLTKETEVRWLRRQGGARERPSAMLPGGRLQPHCEFFDAPPPPIILPST